MICMDKKRPILFREISLYSENDKWKTVGLNTGNLVFWNSLKCNLNPIIISFDDYINNQEYYKNNKVITTDLIWINEWTDYDWLINRIDKMKYTCPIPISVGIQSSLFQLNYKLNKSASKLLNMISERCNMIGVRGEFTYNVLFRNRIKNIKIIGCPSLYTNGSNMHVYKNDVAKFKTISNFRSFYGKLNSTEERFLLWSKKNNCCFMEQTRKGLSIEHIREEYVYDIIKPWMEDKKIFFDIDEWMQYIRQYNFSIGGRFHGNVVSILNNIPALFCVVDARTEEMVKWFKLPYIHMKDFDENKSVDYYYDLANYDEFNRQYMVRYSEFLDFLNVNNIYHWGYDETCTDKTKYSFISKYITARIDVVVEGYNAKLQILDISDNAINKEIVWSNEQGSRCVMESSALKLDFVIKAITSGTVKIMLRGIESKDDNENGKLIPYWIDYKSIVVNGKEQLKQVKPAWFGNFPLLTGEATSGNIFRLHIEWEPHIDNRVKI